MPFLADTLPHPAARIELEEQNGALRVHIAGVRTGRFAKRHVGVGQFFGVQFRPAALQPFLRAPMVSVTDRVVPVARILGGAATAWARGVALEPNNLVERILGNASATAARVSSSPFLLPFGIASEPIHQVIVIYLVLALYRLFARVDEKLAKQVVILGALVPVPIVFVNVLNELAALFMGQRRRFPSGVSSRSARCTRLLVSAFAHARASS